MTVIYGYARNNNPDHLDMQIDHLKANGCEQVFAEACSANRLGEAWSELVGIVQRGDEIRVTGIDRLAREPEQFTFIVNGLDDLGVSVVVIKP